MKKMILSDWLVGAIDLYKYDADPKMSITNAINYSTVGALLSNTYGTAGGCGGCEGGKCMYGCEGDPPPCQNCTAACEFSCKSSTSKCEGCENCQGCQGCELTCKVCNGGCQETCTGCESCQYNCTASCTAACESTCKCNAQNDQCNCQNQSVICQTCQSFCEVNKEALYKHVNEDNQQFVYINPIDTEKYKLEYDADWNALVTFIKKGLDIYSEYKDYDPDTMTIDIDSEEFYKNSKAESKNLLNHQSINNVNNAINKFINTATGLADKNSGSATLQTDMIIFKTQVNKAKISTKVPCCQNGASYKDCIDCQGAKY